MAGVTVQKLTRAYPLLYHMAAEGSWPSSAKHGLLSTSSLLDRFQIGDGKRRALEEMHRPDSVSIEHPKHGVAVVREQKPMSDAGLQRALGSALTPAEWYRLLNPRVFFWVTQERLGRMMRARAYRDLRKTIIVLDTAAVLSAHASDVLLSPMNSGATTPFAHRRGPETFLPLSTYPFDERSLERKETIVEFTVGGGVKNVLSLARRVEEVGGGRPSRVPVGRGLSKFDVLQDGGES